MTPTYFKRDKLGAIAQLGERLRGTQEVGGSIPPGSTNIKDSLLPPRPVDEKIDKNFGFCKASKIRSRDSRAHLAYKNLQSLLCNKIFVPIV